MTYDPAPSEIWSYFSRTSLTECYLAFLYMNIEYKTTDFKTENILLSKTAVSLCTLATISLWLADDKDKHPLSLRCRARSESG